MKVYVKSRNRWKDYAWLPSAPDKKAPYDSTPGETARVVKAAGTGFAVVLPGIPTPRTDNFRRRIEDRLVVEGLDKAQATRLLDLYKLDSSIFTGLVEPHLEDKDDNTQTLTPGLEQDVGRLLTQAAAPAPQQETEQAPRDACQWKENGVIILKLAILAMSIGLLLCIRSGK